jgi:nicotinic acid mononucleotide adenylyltransferase
MAQLAFAGQPYPVVIDRMEIERGTPTFTVDTLRALRAQLGDGVSLAFLMGADQLQKLDTWRDWRALFGLAHLCVAARPGFALDQLPAAVTMAAWPPRNGYAPRRQDASAWRPIWHWTCRPPAFVPHYNGGSSQTRLSPRWC